MTISDVIKRYGLRLATKPDGTQGLKPTITIPSAADLDYIRENKEAVIAELKAAEDAEAAELAAHQARITAIEGLEELRTVRATWENYHYAFNKAMERGDCGFPSKPAVESKEVAAKYPRAAAYLKAEGYANASNYGKSGAGSRAMTAIENGVPYEKALADMETEWTAHVERNAWN